MNCLDHDSPLGSYPQKCYKIGDDCIFSTFKSFMGVSNPRPWPYDPQDADPTTLRYDIHSSNAILINQIISSIESVTLKSSINKRQSLIVPKEIPWSLWYNDSVTRKHDTKWVDWMKVNLFRDEEICHRRKLIMVPLMIVKHQFLSLSFE